MRRVGLLWGLGLVAACAEIEVPLDAAPASADALVGFSTDSMVELPQDASRPRDQFVARQDQGAPRDMQAPCQPGAQLEPCAICDASGNRVAPERDDRCPAVDCAPLAEYRVAQDAQGRQVCEAVLSNPSGPNCVGVGQCAMEATPTVCEQRMVGVTVAVAEGECQAILGCEGANRGEAGPAPQGTPCQDGEGFCNPRGECDTTLIDRCGHFVDFGQLCGFGTLPLGGEYCAVAQPPQANQNCTSFCSDAQRVCRGAQLAGADACTEQQPHGCLDSPNGQAIICWCSP
ncbi:MAG: hypothetical protein KC613_08035 [Myxococcales bacterium]|nr:hypothetical protein [Myxococcales bacterium]